MSGRSKDERGTSAKSEPRAVSRRALLSGFATLPLVSIVSSPALLAACGDRPPDTPLAHLYGREWVHGAYKLYATRYSAVQASADETSQGAYRVLAQKGVTALDALQSRDVPFFVRVDDTGREFALERTVPERLTFTATMSETERKTAEFAWKRAREHVHTDYEEIRRLDWTLTQLLAQLQRIRNAIEEGRLEQYRLVVQLSELKADPTRLPFALPYQVTPSNYEEILLLLLERLEDDRAHLAALEADIVVVGMTVRSTDANSATLAASIRKVLIAVVEDGAAPPRAPLFPEDQGEKEKLLSDARALQAKIEASEEFNQWRVAEREKKLAAFGAFLQVLDQMTGLPTSRIYRTVLDVWRGDHDYLTYLKTVVSLVPHGGAVLRTITEAIEYTEKAREVATTVQSAVVTAKQLTSASPSALADEAQRRLEAQAAAKVAQAKGIVFNTASRFALDRVNRQLSFFKDKMEVDRVTDMLAQSSLMKTALPSIPGLSNPLAGANRTD